MITKDHLVVGNEVYVSDHGRATITKVGRKYTYTTNRHLIIENSRLMTKHTGYGYSTYVVFKSEDDYKDHIKKARFIRNVEQSLRGLNLNLSKARQLNELMNLGVEE